MKKAIFKLNGGNGALLCSQCHVIIKTGSSFTDKEWAAVKGIVKLPPQFCEKCQRQHLYTKLEDKVYKYPTKSKYGFHNDELETLLKDYPNINMDKFNDAMMGNTCMMDEGGVIMYYCDILGALKCGIENRELTIFEWD
jgi:hypothetical protein